MITNFKAVNDSDVINKAYLDENFLKTKGHLSKLEKDYNEYKSQYNKRSVEEILIRRAVKTFIKFSMINVNSMAFPMLTRNSKLLCLLKNVDLI